MSDKTKYIKSPLNYTGGKWRLLPQLIPLFPNSHIRFFVDMFTGGGNVAVNVKAETVIANDFDKNVIDIFKSFQLLPMDYIINYIDSKIIEYDLTMQNKEGYDSFRDDYNNSSERNPLDLFILICYSFNHQIRFNKKGEFNMPFGKERSCFNETIRKNLIDFKYGISKIVFTNKDFRKIKVETLNENDFVYCDPPYLITCATYNEKDGWNEKCERELLELMDRLNGRNVKFALSNVLENKGKTNDILKEWSYKYNIHHLNNTYFNCNYHTKDKAKGTTDEVLITNY